MMIKTHYKKTLDLDLGHNKRNILSFNKDVSLGDELPIIEFGWRFIWLLIKHKLRHKIFMLVTINFSQNKYCYDFFYIRKK